MTHTKYSPALRYRAKANNCWPTWDRLIPIGLAPPVVVIEGLA